MGGVGAVERADDSQGGRGGPEERGGEAEDPWRRKEGSLLGGGVRMTGVGEELRRGKMKKRPD